MQNEMNEIEVKALVRDEANLLAKLHDIGCVLGEPIVQDDTIHLPKGTDPMAGHPGLNVLRIRRQGERAILTLKQNRSNELDCLERETDVTNAAAMHDIVALLGFEVFTHVRKSRRKAKLHGYEICVDTVDDLGTFIEVEKMTDETDGEKVQEELFAFLLTLGIEKDDRVMHGYDTLLWRKTLRE